MNFSSILSFFTSRSITKTQWSRWFGALLVIVIMSVWTITSLKRGEFIPLDSTNGGILIFVFLINGLKVNKEIK